MLCITSIKAFNFFLCSMTQETIRIEVNLNAILTQYSLRWILPYFPLSHETLIHAHYKYYNTHVGCISKRARGYLPVHTFSYHLH